MKFLKLFLIGLPVFLLLFLFFQFLGPGKNKEKERFIVKPETPQAEIIDNLVSQKLLKNRTIFNWILAWRGKTISPGAYLVSQNMNAYQLAMVLTSLPYQKWVTIPEAKRKEQVAYILKQALDWPEEKMIEFIKIAKEGWLYADTYLINTDYDAQQAYQKLFDTFNENLDADLQKALLEKNIRLDTAIKLASLIEKEYGSEEDKKIIAGIIWNRIDKNMRLEIDATVQYAITSKNLEQNNYQINDSFDFWPRVTGGDLRTTPSPYNTYLNKGLPPGPICTPSITTIKAVAFPAETDALYYLHSPDKQIHTAKTYQEHLENIKEFLN
jgi:UPF0755 protein